MIYFIISVLFLWVWIVSEMMNAPHLDDNGNLIKKDKHERN